MRLGSIEGRVAASLLGYPRVGFIVPRYRHSAVARNRLKRRLRELVRLELLPHMPPVDLVVRALPPAYLREFEALARELRQLVRRLATPSAPGANQSAPPSAAAPAGDGAPGAP